MRVKRKKLKMQFSLLVRNSLCRRLKKSTTRANEATARRQTLELNGRAQIKIVLTRRQSTLHIFCECLCSTPAVVSMARPNLLLRDYHLQRCTH